ncbi:PKD domain-containing protein [Fluviicola chungangensis]|uniref:T9SS type B sorting domain-containing protein n=1 Tax=Fluviicola chungangensis TaxID=2597671 RepID=A0A556MRB9_9FLAO|nr:PKD domain-containing protein [Fluviicola chungangensis]TSJ42460.1 T9SS type B sorting domain-containing protein [Fluviicola chungangensis]
MKYIKSLFVALLLSFSFSFILPITIGNQSASAQCNTNTSICTPGTAGPFTFVTPGPYVSSCLDFFGPNMGYIILHITTSGPLNMLINGNASTGFLDVAVFNIPNGQAPCTAIQNLSNEIGCNYASAASGCNQFGNSFPCSSSVPAPYVTAGQEIMIVVENWSGSSSSFTMQLGAGGAQTGSPNPAITPAGPFCISSGSTQLIAADMGGTWSGPGVSSSGMFNPATAGLGTHTINYSVGVAPCNATSSTTITVNSATVTPPAAQTICSGGSATLTASGAGTYTWSPSTGLSATTGATVTASPASTTTYTVTGNTAGCTSSGTVTVTVAPLTIGVSPNASICSGASTTLTATGATNYTWSPATGLSSTTGASVTANPTTTTTYTVTGTTGSCSATANVTVTVTPLNLTVSPNTSICSGASATLTASGATSYSWSPSTGLSASTGASVTASPTTTTTYTVTGTTGSCSATGTVTVTVTPLGLTVSPNTSICNGGSTTLTAGGATNYSWSPSTGLSSTTGASVTANPSTTTTYTVSGTSGSCTSSLPVTVTVTPVVVSVSPNTSICSGTSTTINASGAANYSWSPSTGLSSATGATVTANPTVTTTYTVTGSTGTCANTATMTVTVNPVPTVNATNNGPLCEGSTLQLQATSLPGASYSWSGPNGFSANTQNASTPATLNAAGTYTVNTSLNGCTSSATTNVVVNSGQIPVIAAAGPFCETAPNSILSASIAGGTWSGNGIINATTGEFSPLQAGAGVHSISYSVTGGCAIPGTATITVNPIPVVQISSPNTSGCVPFTASLVDASSPVSGSITWDFGDGTANSNQLNNVNHTFNSAGCYDVTVTSTSAVGCSTTTTFPSFICALPNAIAEFSVNDPIHGLMNPEFHTFNTSANASIYSWDFGDGDVSNAFNPSHIYSENAGNYVITLIANNAGNCPDTAQVTVTIQEELVYYVPNTFTPDGDEFNNVFSPVFTSGFDPYNYTLTIYNRWGETLFESNDTKFGWDGTYNGELCKSGIYTWTIRFKSSQSDKKITKTGHVQLLK